MDNHWDGSFSRYPLYVDYTVPSITSFLLHKENKLRVKGMVFILSFPSTRLYL